MRTYILLAVSVLAGLIAFLIFWQRVEAERTRLGLTGRKVRVLAAKQDMVRGERIPEEPKEILQRVTTREMFVADLTPTATGYSQVRSEEVQQITGKRLAVAVDRGQPLRWADFEDPRRRRTDGFSYLVDREHNHRALSLSVDNVRSVSGLVEHNDRVDIIGTFRFPQNRGETDIDTITLTLLQNITVLAVGQDYGQGRATSSGRRDSGYSTVTLSVTPKEAELLVFAQEKGQLTLTLRHPDDPYVERDTQDVDFRFLKEHIKGYTEERKKQLELESNYRK